MRGRKLHNGTSETIGYDSRSRVSAITLRNSSQTVLRHHVYGYDFASNVTSHAVGGVTTTYGYDLADQLISESRPGYSCTYEYDENGNRKKRTLNGAVETYTNDAADKLTSISGNTVRSFTYDGLGRRKTDTVVGVGTTTYTWDAESRLLNVTGPAGSGTYTYNGLDTRATKTVAGATTTYKRGGAYVTDPLLSEVTGSTTTAHTPGISENRGTNPTQYLHSGIKNADARSAASQSVDATRQYDAFGNLTSSSGTWNGPFGYSGGFGYQEDPESGLKLLGHRYYDSTTGRFLSKDPATDGNNWYGYCSSTPLSAVDCQGQQMHDLIGDGLKAAIRGRSRLGLGPNDCKLWVAKCYDDFKVTPGPRLANQWEGWFSDNGTANGWTAIPNDDRYEPKAGDVIITTRPPRIVPAKGKDGKQLKDANGRPRVKKIPRHGHVQMVGIPEPTITRISGRNEEVLVPQIYDAAYRANGNSRPGKRSPTKNGKQGGGGGGIVTIWRPN